MTGSRITSPTRQVRPHAQHQAEEPEHEQGKAEQERRQVTARMGGAAPQRGRHRQGQQRYRRQPPEVAIAEPAVHQARLQERQPAADQAHRRDHRHHQRPGHLPRQRLHPAFGLQDQPGTAQQRVAGHQRGAGQHRERTEPSERATVIDAVLQGQALHQRAEDHALGEGGQQRAQCERHAPQPA
ncbi:hypothetical protein G6F23_014076 [Rhizopus arrhizus]|nr:hypothetical protein G6F23_014076 [Rhizopus arrhizus]